MKKLSLLPVVAAVLAVGAGAAFGADAPVPNKGDTSWMIVATVLVVSAAMLAWLGVAALGATVAVSGLADAHAATASAAQLVATGRIGPAQAVQGIVLALAANSAMKLGVAWATGGRAYALRLLPGIVAMVLVLAGVARAAG